MSLPYKRVGLGLLLLAGSARLTAQTNVFDSWPPGDSPQEVGKRVAERFVNSLNNSESTVTYPEVASWYGALVFAGLTHDDSLQKRLIQRFAPLMPGRADASRTPKRRHVDDSIFGILPLEIGRETKESLFIEYGKSWADRQWENPQPDGLSAETRYWVDDMYMLTILQLEAYGTTGEKKYLDRAARKKCAYLNKLQEPNGLFHHAPDAPVFWGRGNGWFAAGMAEILRDLPSDHPHRIAILKSYRQ